MQLIGQLYVTLMPVILAGMLNMFFCKSSWFEWLKLPMDCGKTLSDGQRMFGENKTWKGFFGMIVLASLCQLLLGFIIDWIPGLFPYHLVYQYYPNQPSFNLGLGALLGLSYVLFELPNSFVKRRLAIPPGKLATNAWRPIFFVFDQIDSLIGVAWVLSIFYPMTLWVFVMILCLGAVTHILVNQLLYLIKWRRNRF